ncbi:uncharacterized protein LOC141562009 [Sminthopsis crassicaudata]|uniref:uncharacterized protein LOC141562009 n=1 Tax=Sminthopsis crassicaudata TaxID=9301 RepID=UPI003D68D3B1
METPLSNVFYFSLQVPISTQRYNEDIISDNFTSCAAAIPNSQQKDVYDSSILKSNKVESRIHSSHHLIKEESKLTFNGDITEKMNANEKSSLNFVPNSLLPKSECFQPKTLGQLSHLLPVPALYEQTRIYMKEPKYGPIGHHTPHSDKLDGNNIMMAKINHDSESEHMMEMQPTGQVPFVLLNYHHLLSKHGTFQPSSCTTTRHVAENYGSSSEEVNTFISKNPSLSSISPPETHRETELCHYIGTSVIINSR